ncbi:hypothetical protein MtrunA17_Chr5g0404461 [Medicago truncatula]|uniref:Uncharacterized protein n=1 Tax=Medicago truncatula TaxID=3880 RepID=A0A396HLJ6_MEDTR|nr:hypothetical protein MtrunA17_Chr5g0404461 [Medicago truncatula]
MVVVSVVLKRVNFMPPTPEDLGYDETQDLGYAATHGLGYTGIVAPKKFTLSSLLNYMDGLWSGNELLYLLRTIRTK